MYVSLLLFRSDVMMSSYHIIMSASVRKIDMLFSVMCLLVKKSKSKISVYCNFYEGQVDKLHQTPISNKRNTNKCYMYVQCINYAPNFITICFMYNSTFIRFIEQMFRYKFYET